MRRPAHSCFRPVDLLLVSRILFSYENGIEVYPAGKIITYGAKIALICISLFCAHPLSSSRAHAYGPLSSPLMRRSLSRTVSERPGRTCGYVAENMHKQSTWKQDMSTPTEHLLGCVAHESWSSVMQKPTL